MGKTVEQIYQKKTQHEHILTRPDMYIGTIEPVTDDMWVYDEAESIMKQRKCTWIPGLYKIFDEILVNAADNKVRDPEGQTTLKVRIEETHVSVYNNGTGIPVAVHQKHGIRVPEMIFGHLLTSSNYDDDEAKVTGGRNGFGAKLTNVFSTRFEVETVYRRSKFYMRWTNNMLEHGDAVVTTYDGDDYTKVTFYPDFARFHVERFSEDMMLMMKRRVYDVAGCTDKSLKCYLNGNRIELKNFQEYVDLYPTMGEERQRASYARVNDRWEVCVRISNMGFQQVSFVNSIATTRGGTHVKYILDQVITKVTEMAKKKNKVDVKPHMVRPHLFIFVNCLIENPGFDSQTKETLNTVKGKFGSTCDLPNSLIDCVLKSGLVDRSVEMANSKLTKELAAKMRTSDRRQILGIPKLDDANEAGGKQSHRCTLILTEGDSAKTLCTAGLAVKDRDFFGVFPLRGKPLNVRDATLKKVMQNEEVQCVMKIMGLDIQKKYHSVDGLRYGHLMIMSDQDHDGSHIKGLIINFIHHYWPELLNINGFLQQFITPIVKARKNGRGNEGQAISFFSMPDYLDWKRTMGANASHYDIRYYKGLGTSGAKEGREYFENIDRHRLTFIQEGPQDPERIVMAFAKDKVEDRKDWITSFKTNTNPAETVDYTAGRVTYQEFIDKELILFSVADCERSIPSVIDGFKPGQRKILFCCFKRNLSKAIKVVQLAGYVSEHAAYHHGEQSLVQTIVALAQDFVGSNNAPLLQQDGQFGTRLQGGRDHAAGRYIFTRLAQLARCVYHPDDDFVVEYRDDDGLSVEPFFYMPVIPMVLVNGTSGIGTGFSTNIPNYNPIEIIDNLKRLMRGEPLEPMQPWYFGFTGTMEEREKGKFISHGKYTVQPDGVVSITELPVNVWTQNYKKFLEELREKEFVVQYRDHNTDVSVDFDVVLHPQVLQQWMEQNVLEEKLQLREFVHATNIIAFNQEGQIAKYPDAESVLREFYHIRLDFYSRRKDYLLGDLRRLTSKLENMVRFVREVVEGRLTVTRRKKKELLEELRQRQYVAFPPQSKKKMTSTTIQEEADEGATAARAGTDENLLLLAGEEDEVADSPEVQRASRDYDYLLGMRLWNLTAEMIDRLEAQLRKAKNDTEALEKRSPMDLWMTDLDVLRPKLLAYYAEREKEIASTHRKKMEKKKPFNVARLRMPLLSDKARKLLEKEAEKAEKQTGRRPAVEGMTAGDVAEGVPRRRAAPKRRRVKRERNDDDDDSLDESWLYSDNSDGADESDGGGSGHKRSTTAAVKEEADGGADMASSKPSTRRAPRAAKTRGGTNGSSRPARRVRTEPTKVEDTDDFDIDGFGLDALGVPPSAPAMSVRPAVNGANGGSAPQVSHAASRLLEDDDDLLLLGIPPPSARATGPASAPAKAAPKQAPRKSAPKAAAAKKRKRVSSSSDDLSELDDDGDDTSSESSGSFSDSYDDAD